MNCNGGPGCGWSARRRSSSPGLLKYADSGRVPLAVFCEGEQGDAVWRERDCGVADCDGDRVVRRRCSSSSGLRWASPAFAAAYQYVRPSTRGITPNSVPCPQLRLISVTAAGDAVVTARQLVDPE